MEPSLLMRSTLPRSSCRVCPVRSEAVVRVEVRLALVEVRVELDAHEAVLDVGRVRRDELRGERDLLRRVIPAMDLPRQLGDPDVVRVVDRDVVGPDVVGDRLLRAMTG